MIPSPLYGFRALAGFAAVMTLAPILGAIHHHEVDHDGTVLHVESDHGGHFHSPPEVEDQVASQGVAPAFVPAPAWKLPERDEIRVSVYSRADVQHPARPPPSLHRTRAPPLPSR